MPRTYKITSLNELKSVSVTQALEADTGYSEEKTDASILALKSCPETFPYYILRTERKLQGAVMPLNN